MANTIANKLVVKSADSKVIKNLLKVIKGNNENGDNEVIDFNKINAMPSELEGTNSHSEQWKSLCYYILKTNQQAAIPALHDLFSANSAEEFEERYPDRLDEFITEGEILFNNYMKYGAIDSFMWRCLHSEGRESIFEIVEYNSEEELKAYCECRERGEEFVRIDGALDGHKE